MWPIGIRNHGLLPVVVGMALVFSMVSVTLAAHNAFAPPTTRAQEMIEYVRYAAIFNGGNPDAAARKAEAQVKLLMQYEGMTRDAAAQYTAGVMISQAGGLCSGL